MNDPWCVTLDREFMAIMENQTLSLNINVTFPQHGQTMLAAEAI